LAGEQPDSGAIPSEAKRARTQDIPITRHPAVPKKEAQTEARASFTAPTAALITNRDSGFARAGSIRALTMFNTLLCVRLGNCYVDCGEGPANLAEKAVVSVLIEDQPATVRSGGGQRLPWSVGTAHQHRKARMIDVLDQDFIR
jgi:hypothetical protein